MEAFDELPVICLGPYGSGTNFLMITLQVSGILVTNGPHPNAWNRNHPTVFKHYVIEADSLQILTLPDHARFVCIMKHPLHWFKSIQNMINSGIMPAPSLAVLADASLSEIIRRPGRIVGVHREMEGLSREAAAQKFLHYRHLPDLWNQYAKGYSEHLPEGSPLVSYEQLLFQPQQTFGDLIEELGGNRGDLQLRHERRFQDDNHRGEGRNYDEALACYRQPESRYEGYSRDDLAFVEENINMDSMKIFGYAKL